MLGILKELLNTHFWKFFIVLLLMVAAALSITYYTAYYIKKPERDAIRAAEEARLKMEELTRKYNEDTYGGKTPEETLALFIEALKKGDTNLAAKYFVLDKQEEWRKNLEKIKNDGKLQIMINDLEGQRKNYSLGETRKVFDILNSKKEVVASFDIARGTNGIWKILSL
ncbi:hypothetical protein HYS99_01740 [Candidatus Giovannonibacteria bacterium]|nr:hypothetical protein [Candidatus Giovannonibacteria bacterium]